MLNAQFQRRLERLESALREEDNLREEGICVACIRSRQCKRPDLVHSRQCGKSALGLPDVLYISAADQLEQHIAPVDYSATDALTKGWEDRVLADAQVVGLDVAAIEFLRANLPLPEGLMEVANA
jgi:hypothetical protein